MFGRSARLYDALYSWKDYEGEAAHLHRAIQERRPGAVRLLDVACGTGKHLEHLRDHYEVEGIDLEPDLLALARERLPGVPLHESDMRDFDLGRTFDVVTCLFSSIAYVVTLEALDRTMQNLARHLDDGGVLVVEPWFTPDVFETGSPWALFIDEPDLKIARMDVPQAEGQVSKITFHYLVATEEGVDHFTEDHELGLFTHDQYVDAFRRADVEVSYEPEGLMGRGLYVGQRGNVGTRPSSASSP